MKTFLFILFFPITVPVWLLYKFLVWFFEWLGDTFIPFLRYDVFPAIKRYFRETSAEMEKNAEKSKEMYNKTSIHKQEVALDDSVTSNIDYSIYPLSESDDPLFIRALAVASYEEVFTAYTLQRELKISHNRAIAIINQLLENKLISVFKDDKYFSNVSFGYFNVMLEKIIKNEI